MRFVTKAELGPMACAVYPHLGAAHKDGFFDTGSHMAGPGLPGAGQRIHRVYVSVVAVKDMARKLDWSPPEETEELRAEIARLKIERDKALVEVNELERFKQAIDVIESERFRARKKPGRPKVEVTG